MVCFTKIFVVALALEVAIFIVGMADRFLRSAVQIYSTYVPHFWWMTEVWAEMNTNQQGFMNSLPNVQRVVWVPVVVLVTVVLLGLIPGKFV